MSSKCNVTIPDRRMPLSPSEFASDRNLNLMNTDSYLLATIAACQSSLLGEY